MEVYPKVSFEDTATAFSYKSDKELAKTYLIFATMNNPSVVKLGTKLLKTALGLRLPVKGLIKKTVFEVFCGGETIKDCEHTVQQLARFGIGSILDYSVEGSEEEASFDATADEIIRTIQRAQGDKYVPFSVFKVSGIASNQLLEKVQQGARLSGQEADNWTNVQERMERICQAAHDLDVQLLIDGEETWMQDTIDSLTYAMMRKYNRRRPIIYNTYQMYRHDMLGNLTAALEAARKEGYFLGVKLVRGAYMEKERERAAEIGYEDPIQPNKAATDRDYDAALVLCLQNRDIMGLCSGSHNENSNYLLAELMEEYNLLPGDERIYFAQLYGMSDNISFNLANAGYNVCKYVPYGPVKSVMPYLIRRAEENTSIAGQSSREFMLIRKERERRKHNTRREMAAAG